MQTVCWIIESLEEKENRLLHESTEGIQMEKGESCVAIKPLTCIYHYVKNQRLGEYGEG
jgi:hypothetical protein